MVTIEIFWPFPLSTLIASLTILSAAVVYWLIKFIVSVITG